VESGGEGRQKRLERREVKTREVEINKLASRSQEFHDKEATLVKTVNEIVKVFNFRRCRAKCRGVGRCQDETIG
jgi:hypothetical protein